MKEQSDSSNFLFPVIIALVYGNLFIGWSFQNLKIFQLPVNELILLLILIFINIFTILKNLRFIMNIMPYVLWLIYGMFFIILGFLENGIWALRDGSHIIDSFFLFVGFFLASQKKYLSLFFKQFKYFIIIGLIYIVLFPIKGVVENIIPHVTGSSGIKVTNSLFNYTSFTTTTIWLAFYIIVNRKKENSKIFNDSFVPFLFIFFTIAIFQQRMIYLSVVLILIFLIFFNREASKKIIIYIFVFFTLLTLLPLLDIKISGRIGALSDSKFLINHIMSSFPGFYGNETMMSTAGTAQLRLFWFVQLWEESFNSVNRFLFGNGFGKPLIEFRLVNQSIAREPHNGYLSIYGKMGLIGSFIWIWMQINFFKIWIKIFNYAKSNNFNETKNRLLGIMIFIILTLSTALSSSVFEQTWMASIYYLLWGVILKIFHFEAMKNSNLQTIN